jgi:hypothetical protein
MTRPGGWQGQPRPGAGGDDDLRGHKVDALFARQRAALDDLPGDEVHWQAIVRAGRSGARRWPAYVASAAAALVVAAGAGLAFQGSQAARSPSASPSSRTVVLSSSPPARSSTVSPTTPATQSGPPGGTGALRVPVSFAMVSMSNGGGGKIFGLGSAECPAGPCTAVVGSSDDGRTWSTRASFTDLTSPGLSQNPTRAGQLTGIRFANAKVGYAFGSATRQTVDGGRSWRGFDVGDALVLSLETDGNTVWLVTARSCQAGTPGQAGTQGQTATPAPTGTPGCSGLAVLTATVGDPAAHVVPVPVLPSSVRSAWIVMDGKDAYLNAQTGAGASAAPATPVRLTGTPGPVVRPTDCDPKRDVWAVATARDRGALFAVCAAGASTTHAYAVSASADRGQSWHRRSVGGLGAASEAGVWVTASDRDHLVAIPGGLPAAGGSTPSSVTGRGASLLTSEDGGATWHEARVSRKTDGWGWAGAAGGPIVYALDGAVGRYFLSNDRGVSFGEVDLRP